MTVFTARAPGKVNLSLLVGAPRPDGLHPLASVVQSVSLADVLTLAPAGGTEDEVVCPGVEGPNLAAAAAAARRLAAHAAGGAPAALLHELAVALGADVASQLQPGRVLMHGAGEHVEPLPDSDDPFGLVLVILPHALATGEVYGTFDR